MNLARTLLLKISSGPHPGSCTVLARSAEPISPTLQASCSHSSSCCLFLRCALPSYRGAGLRLVVESLRRQRARAAGKSTARSQRLRCRFRRGNKLLRGLLANATAPLLSRTGPSHVTHVLGEASAILPNCLDRMIVCCVRHRSEEANSLFPANV